jgi:SAM-dependent methyltransferase
MTCSLCGGSLDHRATVPLDSAAIHRCRNCGSGILWPRPDQAVLSARHDDAGYFNHPYFDSRRDASHGALFEERVSRLREVLGSRDAPKVLVDLGCDTGAFMAYLTASTRVTAIGVDVSQAAVAAGRAEGRDIRLGTLESQNFADQSVDVLTAFDVVEHVADPVTLMREIARILKPGGTFLAEVPHFNGLVYRAGRALGRWDVLSGSLSPLCDRLWPSFHVQYPTVTGIRRLVSAAGLVDIACTGRDLSTDELAVQSPALRAAVLSAFRVSGWVGAPNILVVSARAAYGLARWR